MAAVLPFAPTPAFASANGDDVGASIIGGTDATETHGAVRLLTYYRDLGMTARCTGTLVTVRGVTGVATAAHCVSDLTTAEALPATDIQIQYGSTVLTQLTTVTASRVEVYPTWDWGTGDDPVADTAVVALPAGLHLTGIPLGDWAAVGRRVKLLGWGKTTIDATEPPAVLQQLSSRITTPDACATAPAITAGEICVDQAPDGGAACFGDSGGGAESRRGNQWVLLGSASRQTTEDCTGPTVYTDATYYSQWIGQVLTNNQPHHLRHVATGAADRFMSLVR